MSNNLGLVTSCVLAVACLIRPFKWPNLMIPLIPESLLELLEAPVPILAGVVYVSPLTRHNLDSIIWVVLDENNFDARVQSSSAIVEEVIEPKNFNGKKKYLEKLYESPATRKLFKSTTDLNENCLKIKNLFKINNGF